MPNPNYRYEKGKIEIRINGSWMEPQFEQYENIQPVGKPGANGVVIKGTHKITGRDEAIKIWLPRQRNGKLEINKKQYLAEIRKIAELKDPRIVTIYNAWTENGCYCCSMELIDGITYESWLEKNSNIDTRIDMLLKIFDAICFYQSQGIVHGDIHSKNIMIEKDGKVRIIDFGTSSLSSYKEQSNQRENFLMYELVEKTLGDRFDKKAFLYKKYHLKGEVKENDDIRKVKPFFFSRSVCCYLKLMRMLNNVKDIINNPGYTYEYCSYITKGVYLDMDYYYSKISGENDNKLNMFSEVMCSSLMDGMYERCQDNPDETEKMIIISLYVYYEKIKEGLHNGQIKLEMLRKQILSKISYKPDAITEMIDSSKDLFELHNILTEELGDCEMIYSIEEALRAVMDEIIFETYGERWPYILREFYFRMEDIKFQQPLCDRIIRLSYRCCMNNGIQMESRRP